MPPANEFKTYAPKLFNMALCVLLMVALLMVSPDMAISCSDAVNTLILYGSYLIGASVTDLSVECCANVQSFNKMTTMVASRRTSYECLKQTGPSERALYLPP